MKRGQTGHIEFFWKKSIHLSVPEHKRLFEPFLEGIRASKEHICVYIQLFLHCTFIEGASELHEANSFARTAHETKRSRSTVHCLKSMSQVLEIFSTRPVMRLDLTSHDE